MTNDTRTGIDELLCLFLFEWERVIYILLIRKNIIYIYLRRGRLLRYVRSEAGMELVMYTIRKTSVSRIVGTLLVVEHHQARHNWFDFA